VIRRSMLQGIDNEYNTRPGKNTCNKFNLRILH
jgi:hypothetical protein